MLEHIRVLSEAIGPRLAGSPQEDETVAYARQQFERWGYQVEVQDFTAAGHGALRLASLTVEQPELRELRAVSFSGSAAGEVRGRLVDAGTGREEEFPPEAAGAIVLIQRRDVFFADMARRAEAAGAVGVVVANREAGLFPATLEPTSDLPMVGIDQADGEALRELLADGPVTVRIAVRTEVDAENVIARPPGEPCRTLSSAHHDSVPWAAGADDNASGSAVVLELARAAAAADLSGHCFVLFGAEELGLTGSEFFVSHLTEEEGGALEAVFNYDAVGGNLPLQLIGDAALAEQAQALAERIGVETEITSLPENVSSDHASFLDAGMPALMLTSADTGMIHTAADTLANVDSASLKAVAELGFAILEEADQES